MRKNIESMNKKLLFISIGLLGACSSIPEASNLSNYNSLTEEKGIRAKYKTFADTEGLKKYNSIYIEQTKISQEVLNKSGEARLDIVANLIDREICLKLAKTFDIRETNSENTLIMKVFITDFEPTGRMASAVSSAIPGPLRLPLGLGKLSAESEVLDPNQKQLAAIIWSHKAAPILTSGGASTIYDAYEFAADFAKDAANNIVPDKTKDGAIENPNAVIDLREKICTDKYGQSLKAQQFIGGLSPIGLPPEAYDSGKKKPDKEIVPK